MQLQRDQANAARRVADAFASAPFEDGGWDNALRTLASETGARHGQLIAIGGRHVAFNWLSDKPANFDSFLDAIDGYLPEVNYRVASLQSPMTMTWEVHYDVTRARHTDERYLEAVRKLDVENGAQMVLAERPGAFFGIALLSGTQEGRSTERQRNILQAVGPDVLAAIRVQDAIEHRGARLLESSFETLHAAAILLDATGRVCFVSDAARPLLGPRSLQVRADVLRAGDKAIDRQLQARIALALAGSDPGLANLWLRGDHGMMLVDVRPLPRRDWQMGFSPRLLVTLRSPLAAVGDMPPAAAHAALGHQAGVIAAAYALTEAEATVAALLGHGLSRQDVAQWRGVSAQTVTTQLRTIFQKCGVHRESELVSRIRAVLETAPR